MSFIAELKRRNVFKVAAAYVVVAWLVLQVIDTVAEPLHLPDWVPSFFILLLAVGFLVALFLAWAYELTPEGVKKAEEVSRDESIAHVTGQKINTLIFVLMAVALGYFIWESRFAPDSGQGDKPEQLQLGQQTEMRGQTESGISQASIAVLPFINLSSDQEQEYFSDGISEELLNLLAGVQGLNVTSRTSAFSFKGSKKKLSEIARELKVAHILEGSIRKAGDTIRVTAQLIRTADDVHLWSSTYDRKLENIFAIQDEIATAIVDALMPHLGVRSKPKVRTLQATNPEVHRLTLQGRYLIRHKRNAAGLKEAEAHLRKAIELDDRYAPAHAALAESLLLQTTYANVNRTDYNQSAFEHTQKALGLDPLLPEAHGVMGLYYGNQWDHEQAMQYLARAIELNPSYSEAMVWKANELASVLKLGESAEVIRQVYQKDPLFPLAVHRYLNDLLDTGQLQEVEKLLPGLKEISPMRGLRVTRRLLEQQGKPVEALAIRLQNYSQNPDGALYDLFAGFEFDDMGIPEQIAGFVKPSLYTKTLIAITRHEFDDLQILSGELLAQDPDNPINAMVAAGNYVLLGKYELACRLLDRIWNRNPNTPPVARMTTWSYPNYAKCLAETGKQERAEEILQTMEYMFTQRDAAGFAWYDSSGQKFDLMLLRGEYEKALQGLQRLYEESPYLISADNNLRRFAPALLEDARYQALAAAIKEKNKVYGQEFMRRACKENPWANVWKPVPGSCEKLEEAP